MVDTTSTSGPSTVPSTDATLHHDPIRSYSSVAVALIFIVPAFLGFLFGYDIGATSYAIVQLMGPSNGDENEALSGVTFSLQNRPVLTGLIVSTPSAGALLGTTIVFGIADTIGRRMELRIGGVLYLVGALLEYLTVYVKGPSWIAITFLIFARLVYGTGIGFAMHGAPTYLGEMCPASIRGALVSSKEVAIVVGILFGYAIGYAYLDTYQGWAYTYLVTIAISSIAILLSYKIPYSARWLVSRYRDQEALEALTFVWVPSMAQEELDAMIQARNSEQQINIQEESEQGVLLQSETASSQHSKKNTFDPTCRGALTAGVGLVALQQITGQPSVLSYATPILVSAGLSSFSSVLIALFKVLATSLAVVYVEKSGRRKLLMIGCTLMLSALVILTISFQGNQGPSSKDGKSENSLDTRSVFTLVAMFVYIGGYQVGFGPIAWLIISEVFPQDIRGKAVALAVQTNFLLNAIVQFGVPVLEAGLGLSFTFGMFAVLSAYSIYFVYTRVPETKGLTLEQIEEKFASMARSGGIVRDRDTNSQPEEEQLLS